MTNQKTSDIDIVEIDTVNFAGNIAFHAAAMLAGLLRWGEHTPLQTWFTHDRIPAGTDLAPAIDAMADYVVRRDAGGEQLYRFQRLGDWTGEAEAIRMAFDLFASTVRAIAGPLRDRQRQAEEERRVAAIKPFPLALEDSIFEDQEPLGALRPEAIEQAKNLGAAKKAGRVQRKLAASKQKAARPRGGKAAKPLPETKSMSVGEAPVRPPVNRGGRGKAKKK